jgi:hypothetical protein
MKTEGKQLILEGIPMPSKQKTFVYTTLQKEGYHSFPEAATLPNFATGDISDVSHLSFKHMHYFSIRIWVQVSHSNRDIEFIQLRRWVDNYFGATPIDFGNRSCEMIAEDLSLELAEAYPSSELRIEVAEDNINGALIEITPEENDGV